MVVARAVILQLHAESPTKAIFAGNAFGVSKQTRRNWISLGVEDWLQKWDKYFDSLRRRDPVPLTRRRRIVYADLQWIKTILGGVGCIRLRSRVDDIRYAAANDPNFGHLRDFNLSTLWRHREGIWGNQRSKETQPKTPRSTRVPVGGENGPASRKALKRRSPGKAREGIPPPPPESTLEQDDNPF
jgi:hypothetical protein